MSSIGNDIIALKTIDIPRTQNPRFYSKILSPAEQQLYKDSCQSIPFHYFLWLLWSVKESAYKCLQRLQPELVFSPVKIEISNLDVPESTPISFPRVIENTVFNHLESFKSIIKFNSQTLYACSIMYGDELIHTVALFQDDFENVAWGIKKINETNPESQSAAVRSFLLDKMKITFPGDDLSIGKSTSGYPFIISNGKEIPMPLSLSHHECYVGYAFVFSTSSPS